MVESLSPQLFLELCIQMNLSLQFSIGHCKPAESAVSLVDNLGRYGMTQSNLHPRHVHRVTQLMTAKYEVDHGRLGSAINVTIPYITSGLMCWCILTRDQRDQLHMPRNLPRCLIFVIVSFDENSVFGVYGELICSWNRQIVLTTVSWGQLRVSDTYAYSTQRKGGVYRRVPNNDGIHDVLALPDPDHRDDDAAFEEIEEGQFVDNTNIQNDDEFEWDAVKEAARNTSEMLPSLDIEVDETSVGLSLGLGDSHSSDHR